MRTTASLLLALVLGFIPLAVASDPLTTEYNDQAFDWYSYDEGIELARAEGKLMLVVIKTDWCPHCQAYQKAFYNERATAFADAFVFVMLDRDNEEEITSTIAPDGDYVPRTMILTPEGKILESLAPFPGTENRFLVPPVPHALAVYLQYVVKHPDYQGH